MALFLPLSQQSPVTAEVLTYYFAALLSLDVVGEMVSAGLLSLDVVEPTEDAALLSADVEGAEGSALILIDLVESELR